MKNTKVSMSLADCFDGQVRKVTYELIGQARLIADQLQEDVHTLLLGAKVAGEAQSLIEYGSDYVHVFEHPLLARYTTDGYTKVITDFFAQNKPNVILIGATNDGRDLAPRISGRMKNGVVADCTILSVSTSDGLVEWTRPALGGNILAEIICPEHRPQMAPFVRMCSKCRNARKVVKVISTRSKFSSLTGTFAIVS